MSALPLSADELALVFGFKNKRGVNRAIRNGTFPIPTYMHEGRRFAHGHHVHEWLETKKREAEEEFQAEVEDWDR